MTTGKLKTFDPKTAKFTITHQYGARFDGMSMEMIISTHIAEAVSSKVFVVTPRCINSWVFGGGPLDDTTEKYLNVIAEAHEYDFKAEFDEENFRVFMHKLLKGEIFRTHFVDEATKIILRDME